MKIFDSHAHYDDERFDDCRDLLLTELVTNENVCVIVNAGASLASTESSAELSEKYPFMYFASGVHPESAHTDSGNPGWIDIVRNKANHKKCVAIGEIGLDYYYGKETAEIQKHVFKEQLKLASEMNLPVVIHDREAHADCLSVISEFPDVYGVFHSYSGSFEMAKDLVRRGWYISFNGILTFKNARKTVEVLEGLKDFDGGKHFDKILVETDCPYLAPVPFRGKTNNSGYIRFVAQKAGEILGISPEEFCELTYNNACRFYRLEGKL